MEKYYGITFNFGVVSLGEHGSFSAASQVADSLGDGSGDDVMFIAQAEELAELKANIAEALS